MSIIYLGVAYLTCYKDNKQVQLLYILQKFQQLVRHHIATDNKVDLTEPHTFGRDPLAGDDDLLQQRDREFTQRCPLTYANIFSSLVSGDGGPLRDALETYIAITENLSS